MGGERAEDTPQSRGFLVKSSPAHCWPLRDTGYQPRRRDNLQATGGGVDEETKRHADVPTKRRGSSSQDVSQRLSEI